MGNNKNDATKENPKYLLLLHNNARDEVFKPNKKKKKKRVLEITSQRNAKIYRRTFNEIKMNLPYGVNYVYLKETIQELELFLLLVEDGPGRT